MNIDCTTTSRRTEKIQAARRHFLRSCGVLGFGALLPGCSSTDKSLLPCPDLSPDALVPQRESLSVGPSFLGIDAHCHIFNAHDVPLSEFLTGPVLHFEPPLDKLLRRVTEPIEALMRDMAPTAAEEYTELCDLVASRRMVAGERVSIVEEVRREIERDDQRFAELMARVFSDDAEFLDRYRSLENEELRSLGVPRERLPDERQPLQPDEILRALRDVSRAPAVEGAPAPEIRIPHLWRFLRPFVAPRYHNAFRLLELYGSNDTAPQIDLFFAAAVDFDSPLKAKPTSTPLRDQLQLMEAIAVVTGGRVLSLAPFDPWRDIERDGEAFELVKEGVTNFGCMGVKLYPPMGFEPYGNATAPTSENCWPGADTGAKLDQSLARLFQWCRENEVPVLAHSSESNGVSEECQKAGGPQGWRNALNLKRGLQAYVGHFGGDTENAATDGYERTRGFATLMQENSAQEFYADLSYMPGIFKAGSDLGDTVRELLQDPVSGGPNRTVADRLLYGSDWFMLAIDPAARGYVESMAEYLRDIGGDELVARVFGLNAVRFFRLANRLDGQPGALRSRLNDFFAQHQLSPVWLKKVDSETRS